MFVFVAFSDLVWLRVAAGAQLYTCKPHAQWRFD